MANYFIDHYTPSPAPFSASKSYLVQVAVCDAHDICDLPLRAGRALIIGTDQTSRMVCTRFAQLIDDILIDDR